MSTRIQIHVELIPSVDFGKFNPTYKPITEDSKAVALLAALKKQFGYKPVIRNGKPQKERGTFTTEWMEYASKNLNCDFIVAKVPTINLPSVGDKVGFGMDDAPAADFSFLQ